MNQEQAMKNQMFPMQNPPNFHQGHQIPTVLQQHLSEQQQQQYRKRNSPIQRPTSAELQHQYLSAPMPQQRQSPVQNQAFNQSQFTSGFSHQFHRELYNTARLMMSHSNAPPGTQPGTHSKNIF